MGDGDVFLGFDGKTHHELKWNLSLGKVTWSVYGAIGWVTVLRHSCGGEPSLQRVHLCAHNPCNAMWPTSKYGVHRVPVHMQPTAWRPLALPSSPTAVVVGEASGAGGERVIGVGREKEEHKEAGGDGDGPHASGGDVAMPEATAVAAAHEASAAAVSEISWDSVQCHDTANKIEDAGAGGGHADTNGTNGEGGGKTHHGGWGPIWRSLHRRPSYRDTSGTALYAP